MLNLYSVRDVKAEAYGAIICCPSVGLAVRSFSEACLDPKSPMALYPADFSLYELGTFDPNSGTVKGHKVPIYVASAVEMLAKKVTAFQEIPA